MLQKLETVLEDSKNYRLEECVIDSLMRIESKDASLYSCRECTVTDIVREDMIGTVFCPLMIKRDLEFRVK